MSRYKWKYADARNALQIINKFHIPLLFIALIIELIF